MTEESRPRRHDFLPTIMRLVSEPKPVDDALQARAGWMANESGLSKYLVPKMRFDYNPDKEDLEVKKSPSVLFVGAGKGHELVEAMRRFPESFITGLDPHDGPTNRVQKKINKNPRAEFLPEVVNAENLQGVEDETQDAVALNFVFHHIDENKHDQVATQINRVLKPGGYLFVAEDLVDDQTEEKITEIRDRIMNWEVIKKSPHNYRNISEWTNFFSKHGFKLVEVNEVKPKSVRHGFFVLEKSIVEEVKK